MGGKSISSRTICRWLGVNYLLYLCALSSRAQDTLTYTNWRLVQAEEFNAPGDSSALAARWRFAYPWGRSLGGFETEYYTGSEVAVRNGSLQLSAHKLATPRTYKAGEQERKPRYTSGMLFSKGVGPDSLRPKGCPPGDGVTYGLFEIRCRQPATHGLFPAFWLFGHPDEIDVFEADQSGFSNNVILHEHEFWRPGPVEEAGCQCFYYWPKASRFAQQYHRYALEWLPGQVTFYFDGVPIRRETRFQVLGCGLNIIANLAVWAWAAAQSDTLAIDYIRVYHPRTLPALPFGAEAARPLQGGLARVPRLSAPERSNPAGEQRWQLERVAGGQVSLYLRDNFNASCSSTLPLPVASAWHGPWVVANQATPIVVLNQDSVAAHWTVLDEQGHGLMTGQAAPGRWQPALTAWAKLAPGAYHVRLQLGEAVRYQVLYVVAQPADSQPTAVWRQVQATTPPATP